METVGYGAGGDGIDLAETAHAAARAAMVQVIRAHGLRDARVLEAMASVRRHRFFPGGPPDPLLAYGDHPCPIGHGQTLSQPFIVAYMTAAIECVPGCRVLDVGCGSGYQSAVLAALGAVVFALERQPALARHARVALDAEGFADVRVRCGDGYAGWAEEAPFDAILVACAPAGVPPALVAQLGEGGRMVLPVGVDEQRLVRVRRKGGRVTCEPLLAVRFVPMVEGVVA